MKDILEVFIPAITALVAGGWAVLRLISTHLERRHDDLAKMIEERFDFSELQRQMATKHWEQLFASIRQTAEKHSQRIASIENRINARPMRAMEDGK
ncbi:MAG: hypothetical protein KDI50_03780 [Candidatus Competibacteraceae bacterium]|nr:hypothetical protein [Candidatus Competibacteraceae bacterium]